MHLPEGDGESHDSAQHADRPALEGALGGHGVADGAGAAARGRGGSRRGSPRSRPSTAGGGYAILLWAAARHGGQAATRVVGTGGVRAGPAAVADAGAPPVSEGVGGALRSGQVVAGDGLVVPRPLAPVEGPERVEAEGDDDDDNAEHDDEQGRVAEARLVHQEAGH